MANRIDPRRRRLLQGTAAALTVLGAGQLAESMGLFHKDEGEPDKGRFPPPGRVPSKDTELTPQMFGAVGDGEHDDTAALQAWADAICGRGADVPVAARIDGRYKTSATITFSARKNAPQLTLRSACDIRPTPAVTGDCLVFDGLNFMTQVGHLRVTCSGRPAYGTRATRHGVVIVAARSTWDVLDVGYARLDGIRIQDGSSLTSIKKALVHYCGSSPLPPIGYSLAFDSRSDAGSNGNPGQTSTLHIASGDIDQLIPDESFLTYGTPPRAHQVAAVDAKARTVTVKPWLPIGVDSGTVGVVCGAGVRLTGGNASKCQLDLVDAMGVGIGIHQSALYPATVTNLVAQSCGIGYLIGTIGRASLGGILTSSYYEGNVLDLVCATLAGNCSHAIGEYVSLDFGKVVQISAKNKAVPQQIDSAPLNAGVKLWIDDLGGYVSVINPYLNDKRFNNAPTIDLSIPDNYHRLFYWDTRHITVIGTGANGAPTGAVTLKAPEGQRINGGGNSQQFAGPFSRSPSFACVLRGNDWTVTKIE